MYLFWIGPDTWDMDCLPSPAGCTCVVDGWDNEGGPKVKSRPSTRLNICLMVANQAILGHTMGVGWRKHTPRLYFAPVARALYASRFRISPMLHLPGSQGQSKQMRIEYERYRLYGQTCNCSEQANLAWPALGADSFASYQCFSDISTLFTSTPFLYHCSSSVILTSFPLIWRFLIKPLSANVQSSSP